MVHRSPAHIVEGELRMGAAPLLFQARRMRRASASTLGEQLDSGGVSIAVVLSPGCACGGKRRR